MRPLPAIGPAALMRLFQEELFIWINTVVHETGELVLDLLELVVGHRLWYRCELAARRPQREPGGVAQESHLSQFLRLEGTAGERMDARACM